MLEHGRQRLSHRDGILGSYDTAGFRIDGLANRPDVGRDDRYTRALRLHHDARQSLAHGRQAEYVESRQDALDIVSMTKKAKPPVDAKGGSLCHQPFSLAALADENDRYISRQLRHRFYENSVPFDFFETTDRSNDARSRLKPESKSCVIAADACKPLKVDPAGHDIHLLRRQHFEQLVSNRLRDRKMQRPYQIGGNPQQAPPTRITIVPNVVLHVNHTGNPRETRCHSAVEKRIGTMQENGMWSQLP